MSDNSQRTPGSGEAIASREVAYSGDTVKAQVVGLMTLTGPDDAKTPTDISASNPLPVDVRQLNVENLLLQILVELRVQTTILATTLGSRDDVDSLRLSESSSNF